MSDTFMEALGEFITDVTDSIDGGPADHRDDFYAEITRHTGDKTTWGGGLGATFYDALAKQLHHAWEQGAKHAWEESNDCGYNGECDPDDPPLDDNPYPGPESS